MLRRIFTTTLYSGISRAFSTATSLFILFFIAKFLGPQPLGIYGVAFTFLYLFFSISGMNLDIFIGKEIAYLKEDKDKTFLIFNEFIVATFFGLSASMAVLLLSVLLYRQISLYLLLLTFITGILLGIEKNLSGFLLGRERMDIEAFYSIVSFFVVLILLLLNKNQMTVAAIFLVRIFSLAVGIIGRLLSVHRFLVFQRFRFKLRFFGEIKYYWFNNIAGFLIRQADVLILSFFVGEATLGGYFLALRIYISLNIVTEVFSLALTPFISRTFQGQETIEFNHFLKRITGFSLVGGILMAVTVYYFTSPLISLFNRDLVTDSSRYLKLLAFVIPCRVMISIMGAFMSSSRFQKVRFYFSIGLSSSFILITVILASLYHCEGAVIARLISEIIAFSLYFYFVFFKMELKSS